MLPARRVSQTVGFGTTGAPCKSRACAVPFCCPVVHQEREMTGRALFFYSKGLLSWMWLLSSSANSALRRVGLV
jgi:hypothetical protein